MHGVARDTIEKAYNRLKVEGYIMSVYGKGYYVIGGKDQRIRVALIFNKLSYYKKVIYEEVISSLGDKAHVDLYIHHYNPVSLEDIVDTIQDKYHFYVLMPHFYPSSDPNEIERIIKKIPPHQLVLLDKQLPYHIRQRGVFQNFREDIYSALCSADQLLKKYNEIIVVFPEYSNHPKDICEGVEKYAAERKKSFFNMPYLQSILLSPGTVFIVVTEADLAQLIKMVKESSFILGEQIGIISFNETIFKELLDITVITTDFQRMGRYTAEMILKNEDKNHCESF